MKTEYAYYIDDGIPVKGLYIKRLFRAYFYPSSMACGFSNQRIWRHDIGRKLFFDTEFTHSVLSEQI